MLGFVAGTGRCGSTLVDEVLARHPEVGFVSNLDDKLLTLDLTGRWNNVLLRRAAPRDPRLGPFRDRPRLIERGRLRVAPSEGSPSRTPRSGRPPASRTSCSPA
jgi:hypothetical protein